MNSVISKRAMQESDLLAFHVAISIANPGAVMCSYNRINGDFGCENPYTLRDVLEKEWGFKGFDSFRLGWNTQYGKGIRSRS